MKPRLLLPITLLLALTALSCVQQESPDTTPARPLVTTNASGTPQTKANTQAKNRNSQLGSPQPSTTPTPATATANRPYGSGAKQTQETTGSSSSGEDYYINSKGVRVRRPVRSATAPPAGATARCRDGTYSFSQSRRGTCSRHGGVAEWL